MQACLCCVSSDQKHALGQGRLRTRTAGGLSLFAFKAMTKWGTEDDFRHFLPRLLELRALSTPADVDDFVLFGKLTYANWRSWPLAEQQAVEQFLTAWGRHLMSVYPHSSSLLEYMQILVLLSDDVTPFLDTWWQAARRTPTALRHFADFASDYLSGWRQRDFLHHKAQIDGWLADTSKEDLLVDKALSAPSADAERLGKAADDLRAWRESR
jgi:hypothetical protein